MTADEVLPHLVSDTYWQVEEENYLFLVRILPGAQVLDYTIGKVQTWVMYLPDVPERFCERSMTERDFFYVYSSYSSHRGDYQNWVQSTKEQFETLLAIYKERK